LDQGNWHSSCTQRARPVYRWVQDEGGDRAGVYGQSVERWLSFSLGRCATVFQDEIYAILVCVCEIQFQNRPEKYVSNCSDSQKDLNALQAVRIASPLVQQCQKALNDISTRHAVGLCWVPGHAGVRSNEIADELTTLQFVVLETALGVTRQDIRRRIIRWCAN